MNTIVPASLSRVKIAALGSYMHLLNINDDFPGSSLTGNELEIGNKLCKWVVLVVSSALSRLQMMQEEQRIAKMMKKSKDYNREGGGGQQLLRASTSPTTHRGGGTRGGGSRGGGSRGGSSSHNRNRNAPGVSPPLGSMSLSRSQGPLAINNSNNNHNNR